MTKANATLEAETIERKVGEKVRFNLMVDKDATTDQGNGILEAIITTSSLDRHNENIITAGIDTSSYMDNPVVLYGHDYFGLPIGKTLKLTEQKNKIKAQFQLAIEEYDFAGDVYKLIQGGYLNAVSIGGIVRKWSDDYRTIEEMEMIEFSIVSIPSNRDAIITSRALEDATGKSIEQVSKDYDQFVHRSMFDKLKDLGNDEVTESISTLEKLISVLKESAKSTNSSAGEAEPLEVKRIKKYRLMSSAKAVVQEAERTVRVIKLKK